MAKLTHRSSVSTLLKALRAEREAAVAAYNGECTYGEPSPEIIARIRKIDFLGKSINALVAKHSA